MRLSRTLPAEPSASTTTIIARTQLGSNWVPAAALDLGHRRRQRQRLPVDAVLGHGVEGVADGDHARAERDARRRPGRRGSRGRPSARGWSAPAAPGRRSRAPARGCGRRCRGAAASPANSSPVSGPGLRRIASGMPILPMSCSSAPSRITRVSAGVDAEPVAERSGQLRDLAGVVVRVGVLGLERRRQRAQRGEVGVLQPLGHARPLDHRAGLGGQRGGQPQLARRELAAACGRTPRSARTARPRRRSRSISSERKPSSISPRASAGSRSALVERAGVGRRRSRARPPCADSRPASTRRRPAPRCRGAGRSRRGRAPPGARRPASRSCRRRRPGTRSSWRDRSASIPGTSSPRRKRLGGLDQRAAPAPAGRVEAGAGMRCRARSRAEHRDQASPGDSGCGRGSLFWVTGIRARTSAPAESDMLATAASDREPPSLG